MQAGCESRLDDLVHEISDAVDPVIGDDFFRSLVIQLSKTLRVEYAVIAESESPSANRVRTRALSRNGEIVENISHAVSGSPCEAVLSEGACTIVDRLPAQFPGFSGFDVAVQSYCGAQLVDSSGAVLGVIAVMDRNAMREPEFVQSAIEVFAVRAAAELERSRHEQALRDSEQRHRALVESAPVCIHEIDRGGRILSTNPAGAKITGSDSTAGLVGRTYLDLVAPWDRERVKRVLGRVFKGRAADSEVTWLVDGTPRTITTSFIPMRTSGNPASGNSDQNADGDIAKVLGYSQDITKQKQSEEKLAYMARHDFLTGLPNRGLFLDRLHIGIKRARRSKGLLALLYLDLNSFKPVNDEYGHEAGDRVLEAVAGRLQASVREMDTVARLGGDEFAVILEAIATADDASAVASKLTGAIEKPIGIGVDDVRLGASAGIAIFPENGTAPAELMRYADAEMYREKRSA